MTPDTTAFPIIDTVRDIRTILASGLIPEIATHLKTATADVKTAVASVSVVADDFDKLAAQIQILFGSTAPVAATGPVGGWFVDRKRRHILDHVKRAAQEEYRAHGLTRCEPIPGILYPASLPSPHWDIDSIWPQAVLAGVEEVALDELVTIPGFETLVNGVGEGAVCGKIWDWIKQEVQWVRDHPEEVFALVLKVLSFLLMIGLL